MPQVISNLIKKKLITQKKIIFKQGYFEDIYLSRNRWRVLGFSLISLGGIFISTGL